MNNLSPTLSDILLQLDSFHHSESDWYLFHPLLQGSLSLYQKHMTRLPSPYGECVPEGKNEHFIYTHKNYSTEVFQSLPQLFHSLSLFRVVNVRACNVIYQRSVCVEILDSLHTRILPIAQWTILERVTLFHLFYSHLLSQESV